MKKLKKVFLAIAVITSIGIFTGCALFSSRVNDIKGKLTGNSYSCYFYDNSGNKFMTAKGEKIGAFGLTEPGAGTDAAGQQTTAVLDEAR